MSAIILSLAINLTNNSVSTRSQFWAPHVMLPDFSVSLNFFGKGEWKVCFSSLIPCRMRVCVAAHDNDLYPAHKKLRVLHSLTPTPNPKIAG